MQIFKFARHLGLFPRLHNVESNNFFERHSLSPCIVIIGVSDVELRGLATGAVKKVVCTLPAIVRRWTAAVVARRLRVRGQKRRTGGV